MTPRSPFQRFMAELRRRHVPQTAAVYAGRDSAPFPPPPPRLVSPAFRDSLAGMIDDSGLREPDAGDGTDIGAPETWRFGAPEPVRTGDTIHISGIARAEEGVRSVEVDGRVVARSRDGAAQLPFEAAWVAGEGRGVRRVTVVVRTAGGETIERHFSVTLIPPSPGG